MRSLLDVNVLIALLDADHIHHKAATDWLGRNIADGWASCPLTQNGCVRIMSQPGYPNPIPTAQVAERLAEAAATAFHTFWPDDVNMLVPEKIDWSRILASRQVTDAYLLALAVKHHGRLVTFDQAISPTVVPKAKPINLVSIPVKAR